MSGFVAAAQVGISAIPVDSASKRAMVRWGMFQEEIPELIQLQEWDRAGHNIAWVTGQVSGRLVCLDFEVGFMPRLAELGERLKTAGVYEVFKSWTEGYSEETPSGGMHVFVRVEGDGPCAGNTKLAVDAAGKVLIETRGEGGYAIVAPSRHGDVGWVLLRGGRESVRFAAVDEYGRVEAVLQGFDEAPAALPALTVATRSTVAFDDMLGDRWVDAAVAALGDIRVPLAANGWQPTGGSDSYGEHWTRPGKDVREGSSGSISVNDRLYVHSSNAGMHVGNPTYDVLDVILFYELGHDPSLEERVGWLQARRPPLQADAGAASGGGLEVADANISTAPHIEDWFWESRRLLTDIYETSMRRGLSPDGVFGAWLPEYAATVPMGMWLAGPPKRAPLNLYSCLVGVSGTSKSASMGVASELVGWNVNTNPNVLLGRGLRSGEGLCKLATIDRKRGDDGPPAYRNAVHVAFDEGGTLGKQAERTGSTVIPFLNTAWSGHGMVGGALAREVFEFPADLVRVCVVMGVQYGAAGNLFTGESALLGFPQRLLYFGLRHPGLATSDVDNQESEPAQPLDIPFWSHADHSRPSYLHFPDHIEHQVRLWTQNKNHGEGIDDPLDGHQMNLTKRVAAVLTLADNRTAPNDEDWALAAHVVTVSRHIRRTLHASLNRIDIERQRGRINEAVKTADALDDRWLRRRASRIARHIHTQENGCTIKDIRRRLASDEKKRVHEIIATAAASDWVIHKDSRYFGGGSQPAL